MLTDHKLKRSDTLKELVSLGPDALPLLLDALDDKTPTKIVLKHATGFGAMWYGSELGLNPVNSAEIAIYNERLASERRAFDFEKTIEKHTVTVGDVCFVAVGQIVGRGYSAVRYQPTACIVINSTTQDPTVCAADVRAIWMSKDSWRNFLDALLADYATEGISIGESSGGSVLAEVVCMRSARVAAARLLPEGERAASSRSDWGAGNVGTAISIAGPVANGVRAESSSRPSPGPRAGDPIGPHVGFQIVRQKRDPDERPSPASTT